MCPTESSVSKKHPKKYSRCSRRRATSEYCEFFWGRWGPRPPMVTSVNFVLGEENLLLSSAHSLEERNEWHESFIVSWFAKLLHQGLGLLLGQLLSEVGQQTEKLVGKHGVVVVFVVELEDLNEVVESTLVLGVLAGLVHGEDLSLGQHLLALLLGSSDLLDGLEGGVEVAGTDEVSGVEGVNLAISLEVIDVESEFDGVDLLLLKTKLSHVDN